MLLHEKYVTKKKRVPISSLKTLLSQKLASFLEMKRATRLSHKAVHDMKTRFMNSYYSALAEESRENFGNTGYIRS